VLRRRLQGRVRYEPADRLWFAALSSLIPRRRWATVFLPHLQKQRQVTTIAMILEIDGKFLYRVFADGA
jgi:hypothetical protein